MARSEDITEEKQAKEQLAEQDAEYRRTLEQRVAERTAELRRTNQQLQDAIQQRQKAEAALAQKAADEAVTAERTRLARALHDAVTQTLFSLFPARSKSMHSPSPSFTVSKAKPMAAKRVSSERAVSLACRPRQIMKTPMRLAPSSSFHSAGGG